MVKEIMQARLKILLKEKDLPFWTLIFPIFISSFLYLGCMGKEKAAIAMVDQLPAQTASGVIIKNAVMYEDAYNITYILAIIAMTCMMTGFMGIREMEDQLSWISAKGIRMNAAPVSPWALFGCSLCISWLLAIFYVGVNLSYIKLILGIGLRGPIGAWALFIGLSVLLGQLMGMVIGGLRKSSRILIQGQYAVFIIVGCILAGLIDDGIKFRVDAMMPLVAEVNPASVIVEGLYTLCLYGATKTYVQALITLVIWNVGCLAAVIWLIRGKRL